MKPKSKENITPRKSTSKHINRQGGNLINQGTITSLNEEILYLWETYKVDKVYQDAFIESMSELQPKMHIQILAKEIENLYNRKATIQQLFMSIHNREDRINSIKEIIKTLDTVPTIKEKVVFYFPII